MWGKLGGGEVPLTTNRRRVLESLAGTALFGGTVASQANLFQNTTSPVQPSNQVGWSTYHTTYGNDTGGRQPLEPGTELGEDSRGVDEFTRAVSTAHSLTYLNVQWNDWGNPLGERGGCWQHTFALTGKAMGAGYHSGDDYWSLKPLVAKSLFRTIVPEEGETNGVGPSQNKDAVAVGARRDPQLVGHVTDSDIRQAMQDSIGNDYDRAEDLVNSIRSVPPLSKPMLHAPPGHFEEKILQNSSPALPNTGGNGNAELFAMILAGIVLGQVPVLGTVSGSFVSAVLGALLGEKTQGESPDFSRGFEWGTNDGGLGLGHYCMFDVFVAPGESATVTVDSNFTPGDFSEEGLSVLEPPWRDGISAEFDPMANWEIGIPALAADDEPQFVAKPEAIGSTETNNGKVLRTPNKLRIKEEAYTFTGSQPQFVYDDLNFTPPSESRFDDYTLDGSLSNRDQFDRVRWWWTLSKPAENRILSSTRDNASMAYDISDPGDYKVTLTVSAIHEDNRNEYISTNSVPFNVGETTLSSIRSVELDTTNDGTTGVAGRSKEVSR